jgi:nitrogen PTS system EIIA component
LTYISVLYKFFGIEIEATMQLTSFLKPDLVILDHSFKSVTEIIQFIIPSMVKDAHLDKSSDEIIQLFIEREKQDSTAYPAGIAIPHIRIDNLQTPIISIVLPTDPVLVNQIPIRMFALIITDKTASKLYLNIVKAILGIVRNKAFFDELCSMKVPGDLISLIHKDEIRILNEVTVGDIMSTKFITIEESALLRDLSNLIENEKTEYFPVVNANQRVVGEVTLLNYLQVGIPKYTLLLENVHFPQTIEPLEDIFLKENYMTVKEIMIPVNYQITISTSISEAVFHMVKRHSRYLPIFKGDDLVGVLSLEDIFKKVIRG